MKGTWATYLIIPNMAIAMNYNKMREIDLRVILQKYGDFGIAVPQGKKC